MPDTVLPHSDHKILVVEDDRTLREALRYNLVAAGYEVVVASDGGEGLVSARHDGPDVVVLDELILCSYMSYVVLFAQSLRGIAY